MCPHDGWGTVLAARYRSKASLIGHVFDGRFRVEGLIGSGGMGTVYRATQLTVDRPVALKVLRQELAGNLEQVRRFQNEARAASRLSHPNAIRLFDFGQTDTGELFLVMELLEGEPLSTFLRREAPIPTGRAVRITAQVLKALAEAHDHGIVHRDLKPDNIFLTRVRGEEDFVKVLDFGIAKVAHGDAGGDLETLTRTGMVMGTPTYMAPEQAAGRGVDARSDLYAMGVILFELLSGRPPFRDATPLGVLLHHLKTPAPRLSDVSPHTDRRLCAVVSACLEKDPERRPASADSLRRSLEDLDSSPGAEAAPTRVTPTSPPSRGGPTPARSARPTRSSDLGRTKSPKWATPTAQHPDGEAPSPSTIVLRPDSRIVDPSADAPTRLVERTPDASTDATVPGADQTGPDIAQRSRRWPWVVATGVGLGLAVAITLSLAPSQNATAPEEAPRQAAPHPRTERDEQAPEPESSPPALTKVVAATTVVAPPVSHASTRAGASATPPPARRGPDLAEVDGSLRRAPVEPSEGTRSGVGPKPRRKAKAPPAPSPPVIRIKKM